MSASLQVIVLNRAMKKAQISHDHDALASVLTWNEEETPSVAFTLHSMVKDKEEASKIQVKLCMTLLLEVFRNVDTKQAASFVANIKGSMEFVSRAQPTKGISRCAAEVRCLAICGLSE